MSSQFLIRDAPTRDTASIVHSFKYTFFHPECHPGCPPQSHRWLCCPLLCGRSSASHGLPLTLASLCWLWKRACRSRRLRASLASFARVDYVRALKVARLGARVSLVYTKVCSSLLDPAILARIGRWTTLDDDCVLWMVISEGWWTECSVHTRTSCWACMFPGSSSRTFWKQRLAAMALPRDKWHLPSRRWPCWGAKTGGGFKLGKRLGLVPRHYAAPRIIWVGALGSLLVVCYLVHFYQA